MTRYIVLVGFLILALNIALAVLFLRVAGAEPSTTPVDAVMLEAQPCTLVAVYARGYSIWHCVRQFKEEGVIIEIETQPSGNVRYIPDPCLALMEQAMRAMEPFSIITIEGVWQLNIAVLHPNSSTGYILTLPYEEPATYTPYGLTQTLNAQAGRAIMLWSTAKAQCWREK